jgi:DNA-binding transcriptional MerR regulator
MTTALKPGYPQDGETGLVEPSLRRADGSGSDRLWDVRDVLILKAVSLLSDAGLSTQRIRLLAPGIRPQTVYRG